MLQGYTEHLTVLNNMRMYRSKFIINVRRLSHAAFMKSSVIEVKYLQGNNSLLYYRYMPHTLYYISVIIMNYGPRQCLEGKRANNITGIVYAIVLMTAGNMISSTFFNHYFINQGIYKNI